ncbi:MAG: prephenate dehydrogenase/arogenate dehydrogenase family protein [Candidatus Omnitrophota bacterium]
MRKFGKIAIIGVGLIGGSIGLAVKSKRLASKVVGIGHRQSSINRALKLKAIDIGTLDPREGVKGADIVILAMPILSMLGMVKKITPHLKDGAILTDVGSTKGVLTREIDNAIPKRVRFVGAHPMAGSEKRGVDQARRDLFCGSLCILTKAGSANAKSLNIIKGLWRKMGAEVVVLSPERHDRVVAEISHLPHMLVFSMLSGIDLGSLKFASSGFCDTTRIAASDPKIWRDITITNSGEIIRSISGFKKELSSLEKAIRQRDGAALLRIFKLAKARRERLRGL